MTVMAAMSYLTAILLDLSGILSIFFCGITMSHYTWHSISASARVMSVHNFRVLATIAEMFLFIYAGLDTSSKVTQRLLHLSSPESRHFLLTTLQLAFATLGLILIVRALFVAIAVAIVNLWRSYKFSLHEAIIMWYCGLVRGSITTALVYSYFSFPESASADDEIIVVASVLVVVISTVFFGGLSGTFMQRFSLPPVQSRLIQINTLPSMVREDDTSINSAAVRSAPENAFTQLLYSIPGTLHHAA
jgi:NhaP-type Na+/H+ or K+/H+ antiporter